MPALDSDALTLLASSVDDVTRAVVAAAKSGDMAAARLVLDIWHRTVEIAELKTRVDALERARASADGADLSAVSRYR